MYDYGNWLTRTERNNTIKGMEKHFGNLTVQTEGLIQYSGSLKLEGEMPIAVLGGSELHTESTVSFPQE